MHLAAQKLVDRVVGTPLCMLLGVMDRVGGRLRSAPETVRSILLVKFVAMGDAVLILTVLRRLREAFPEAHITVLTTPRAGPVLRRSSDSNETLIVDVASGLGGLRELARLLVTLRRRRYDVAIDLEQYYRVTTLIARFSGAPRRLGFAIPRQARAALLTDGARYRTDRHELLCFLDVLRPLGIYCRDDDVELLPFPVEDGERRRAFEILRAGGWRKGDLLVGLHPGSGPNALSRRWPAYGFAATGDRLAKNLGARIVVTGGSQEEDLTAEVARLMRHTPIMAVGRTGLGEFAALLAHCDLFVTNDSGPMHLAASMGVRVLGLFGPNIPEKWRPWGAENMIVQERMRCSPCTRLDLDQVSDCRDNQCMKLLAPSRVIAVAEEMIAARRPGLPEEKA